MVAVGRDRNRHFPLAQPIQSPPTIAFRNFGPLIFGHRALNLNEQTRRWIVQGRLLKENDCHPRALEFFQQDDLVGIVPGKAVRMMDQHSLERPLASGISQGVYCGPGRSPDSGGARVNNNVRRIWVNRRWGSWGSTLTGNAAVCQRTIRAPRAACAVPTWAPKRTGIRPWPAIQAARAFS